MHRAHNCKTTNQFLKQTSSVYLHNYKTISDILIKHRNFNKSYDSLQHLMPNSKEISGQCKIIQKRIFYFENKRILKSYLRENKIAKPSNTVYIIPVDVSCGEIWEMLSNSRKWSEENKFIITGTSKRAFNSRKLTEKKERSHRYHCRLKSIQITVKTWHIKKSKSPLQNHHKCITNQVNNV